MKKTLMILVMLVTAAMLLVGCGSQDAPAPTTTAPMTDPTRLVDIADEPAPTVPDTERLEELPYAPFQEELILGYRNQVKKHLSQEDYFLGERELYLELGHEPHVQEGMGWLLSVNGEDWCYPVLYRKGSGVVLVAITEYGVLKSQTYEWTDGEWQKTRSQYDTLQGVHTEKWNIKSTQDYALDYTLETGEIKMWAFGEVTTYQMVSGARYIGYSETEGYIFRHGTDVYSFREGDCVVVPIAHGVKFVIDVDFDGHHDFASQPLFLMEDGTLKYYLSYNEEKWGASDHPGLLYEVPEGGKYRGAT